MHVIATRYRRFRRRLRPSCPKEAKVQLNIRGERTEPGSAVYVWFIGHRRPVLP